MDCNLESGIVVVVNLASFFVGPAVCQYMSQRNLLPRIRDQGPGLQTRERINLSYALHSRWWVLQEDRTKSSSAPSSAGELAERRVKVM